MYSLCMRIKVGGIHMLCPDYDKGTPCDLCCMYPRKGELYTHEVLDYYTHKVLYIQLPAVEHPLNCQRQRLRGIYLQGHNSKTCLNTD